MHIADGILPATWCAIGHGVALAGIYITGRKVDPDEVVRMGLLSSAAFVVSLIHFPLGGTSVHLGLFGLMGILLGKRALPVLYATLLFQSLAFQHGGLLTLGLNTLNMAAGALIAAAIWSIPGVNESLKAFAGGFVGIMIPALLIAAQFEGAGYGKGIYFIGAVYLAAAAIEACLTVAVLSLLRRVKPAVLTGARA
jgi:cobalt/nickel transport system permease protein